MLVDYRKTLMYSLGEFIKPCTRGINFAKRIMEKELKHTFNFKHYVPDIKTQKCVAFAAILSANYGNFNMN